MRKVKGQMFLLFAMFLCVVFCFGFIVSQTVTANAVSPIGILVAIDAGHGGLDGGTVGTTTGITESELNLIYSKKLTKYLQNFGINVVNTRTDMNGLYNEITSDYKLVDMKKRVEIINNSNAQILISIHMNKFTDSSENGAQVFFKQNDTDSEKLSISIKNMLTANFENARNLTLKGDYYILNNSKMTGVIVECGFLSNANEEQNLILEEYQNKICYSIYAGIINYLGVVNY